MKYLLVYYVLTLVPLAGILMGQKMELINSTQFIGLFFFYLLIYRTCIDGMKLASKNLISKKDIWKLIIPGKRLTYARELYFRA